MMTKIISRSKTIVKTSSIHGRGLFAASNIEKGELIGFVQGVRTNEDGPYVLWVDGVDGYRVTCDLRFINHSNTPNAVYYDTLEVCALEDIKPGEEITHCYGEEWAD